MKQLLYFDPIFTPGAANVGTLDFSNYPGFQIDKLYAVINVTRNTPMYIPGAPGYGGVASNTSNKVLTLSLNTSNYAVTDEINVYYDVSAGYNPYDVSSPQETGGQLQLLQEKMDQILVELKLQTELMTQGFVGYPLTRDDSTSLRNEIENPQNIDNINSQL